MTAIIPAQQEVNIKQARQQATGFAVEHLHRSPGFRIFPQMNGQEMAMARSRYGEGPGQGAVVAPQHQAVSTPHERRAQIVEPGHRCRAVTRPTLELPQG